MRIERIPTDPPGEVSLERQGSVVVVEQCFYDDGPEYMVRIRVPLVELWRLLVDEGDFRFEGLTADQLRSAVDHARWHGWGG
jgi:hypothetical protein